jgi:APA family basic amino acid/polyamine antiporter
MGSTTPGLKRQLGPGAATALIAGQTIAVGIFLTPAGMAASLGSPFWLLIVWLTMGVMTVCGALCYGALAARYPETGGTYVYLRNIYGPRLAFLYGWMCLVVMDPGLTAVLAIGFADYVARIVPFTPLAMKLAAMALIVLLGAINVLGTRLSVTFMNVTTWVKIALLAALPVFAIVLGRGDWANVFPLVRERASQVPLTEALAGGLVAAFFSFGGWWELSRVAGEVKQPEKNLPRALVGGVLIVLAVYLLVSTVFLYVVPLYAVVNDQTFVAQMGTKLFGARGEQLLSGLVILSVVSSMAAMMFAVPRVYMAMAADGVFLKSVADTSRFGTPLRAIVLQAVLACVLVLLGSFDQIISYFIFASVMFVGLAAMGAIVLQRRGEVGLRFGYPFTPAVFGGMVIALLFLLLVSRPTQALLGLAITACGLPLYSLARR